MNFFGPRSEFVISGSDCGNVFIWDKKTEAIVQWMPADEQGIVSILLKKRAISYYLINKSIAQAVTQCKFVINHYRKISLFKLKLLTNFKFYNFSF